MTIRAIQVVGHLEQYIGVFGQPFRLVDAIDQVLQERYSLPPIQAAERAERLEDPVRQLIITSQLERETQGTFSVLSISSSSDRYVVGSCYPEAGDSPTVVYAKQNRISIQPLLDQIRNLSFSDFERFGARILRELGASRVWVTPSSDDQGIDFYGILSLGQFSGLPYPFGKLAHDVSLMFAGQAKHYPSNPIGPNFLRELVGSVSLARHNVFSGNTELFDELSLLPFNPLVTMIFTTGRFTSGALALANKSGIIARSGEQLAVFLADKGVGNDTVAGVTQFSQEKFFDWLNDPNTEHAEA